MNVYACVAGYVIAQNGRKPGSLRPSEPENACTRNLDYKALIRKLSRPYAITGRAA